MPTKSERLFDLYCKLRGYASEPIATGPGQTPDRLIATPRGSVVAEIKELTANDDDLRQLRELQERRFTIGGGTPGARVFEKMRSAAPQLKAQAGRNIPYVLVLFDNIAGGGWRIGGKYLDSSMIDFGMYGLQTVLLARESPHPEARLVSVGSGRGGRRQMSEDERVYISAVQVMSESPGVDSEPFVITYHNCFAAIPLPRDIFRGQLDRHFAKPSHPAESPQLWDEVTA